MEVWEVLGEDWIICFFFLIHKELLYIFSPVGFELTGRSSLSQQLREKWNDYMRLNELLDVISVAVL